VARNQYYDKTDAMNTVPMKMCSVYLLSTDDSILITGTDYEITGPGGLDSGFVSRISKDAVDSLLGLLTIHTLNQTKMINGKFWDEKNREKVLNIAGVKSNRAFVSKARCVIVLWKDNKIKVLPTKRDGAGHSVLDELSAISEPEPETLRDVLLAKLQDCQ